MPNFSRRMKKVRKMINKEENHWCNVCQEEYSYEDDTLLVKLPWKHLYHKEWIIPWLNTHNTWPGCRFELPTDDIDYENNKLNSQDPNYMRNLVREANSSQRSRDNDDNNDSNQSSSQSSSQRRNTPSYFF